MATAYSVKRAKHATLSTTTVDTVTLNENCSEVLVINYDGTNKVFFTLDGTTPAALADDSYVVPITNSTKVRAPLRVSNASPIVVSVVGSGGAYSVVGLP